jgi:hypothetical protein
MPNRALTTPVTNLDFDSIKENLKTYLAGSSEFNDFDYEGSGINVLLDLLAYNTHYMALYANMLASESFIDSAVLRRSLVSLAKNLGYVPSSKVASTANVDIVFGTTSGVPASIPQGTQFYASKDGRNYTFTTTDVFDINKTTIPYTSSGVEIKQGVYKSASFIYRSDSNSTKFEIPSSNIDTTLTKIYVMASPSDLGNMDVSWKQNTNFIELTSTSKVYFLNENYRGNYEISFGDGILGAKPSEGSFISIIYLETDGIDGNDIGKQDNNQVKSFSFGGIGGDDFDSVVTTTTPSYGGGERESSEKIRYTAPKFYQAQDRAVTASDFESIVLSEYSAADSVRVWGGEQNDPPMAGKVFVCILPKNTSLLSDAQKDAVKRNILDKKKIVSITPEIVDPDYTFFNIICYLTYDSNRAFVAEAEIGQSASLAVRNYFNLYLGKFNAPFRYSVLSRFIDLSSNSIVSNRVNTTIYKKIVPTLSSAGNYSMDFGVPLNHPYDNYDVSIVKTSTFKHKNIKGDIKNCFIEDNGNGRLAMYTQSGSEKILIRDRIGTIDYRTGKVSMTAFNPVGTGELPYITFEVVPDQRFDIIPKRNQVLELDPNAATPVKINFLDSGSGNY